MPGAQYAVPRNDYASHWRVRPTFRVRPRSDMVPVSTPSRPLVERREPRHFSHEAKGFLPSGRFAEAPCRLAQASRRETRLRMQHARGRSIGAKEKDSQKRWVSGVSGTFGVFPPNQTLQQTGPPCRRFEACSPCSRPPLPNLVVRLPGRARHGTPR
jgi:hypothetical protein